jgi:YD repeat-containing protein
MNAAAVLAQRALPGTIGQHKARTAQGSLLMNRHWSSYWTCVFLVTALPAIAYGQSATYHLHKERSTTSGLFELKAAGPDAAATTIALDLKNQPVTEYLIKAFDTDLGTPNASGIIPAGSVVSATLWLRKTTSAGMMYPRASLRLNSVSGQALCTLAGTAPLSTTVSAYSLSCTTSVNIAMTATDRFYLSVSVNLTTAPGNNALKAELRIEGTLNDAYDSTVTAPLPILPPVIGSVSPGAAVFGAPVSIVGSNFGAAQDTSVVTFNGVTSAPTAWTASSITAPVPNGASSGPVVVTARGLASNGVPFTVLIPPPIAGVVSRASGGTPIASAAISVLSMGAVVQSATTAADGSYAVTHLDPGSYELRISAAGYSNEVRQGVIVGPWTTTTVNVAMSMPGAVSGRVVESDGATPISSAQVSVYAGPTRIAATSTDAAGNYGIPSLHPGDYLVQAATVGRKTSERTAAIAESATTTVTFALEPEPVGPVLYAYDGLGRLVQITDPAGEFAVYRYDAVGNLLAIDRPGGGVAISAFMPNSGPVGASVTISGGGFGAAVGENVVTFNGTAAPIQSATPTQLIATVPAGATTGPIGVSTLAGSAQSRAPFTVAANAGVPTITSFAPTIGMADTAFQISGTNFDSAPINDRVELNGRVAIVASANPATLATAVPRFAMGGPVSVATARGTAVSGSDFFVVPSPYVASDAIVTERMTIGTSRTVTIGTSGKVGLVLFDAVDGQQVSFTVSNSNIPSGLITIYRPDAQPVAAFSVANNTFLDSVRLSTAGTYTILIDPASTNTGTLTLNSYAFGDVSGPIPTNGTGVPVSIVAPGQNALLTFPGTAGQLVSATATSSTWASCLFGGYFDLALLNPDGSLLRTVTNACGSTTVLEHQVLPVSGTYTLRLNPYTTNTGSATLAAYAFTDVAGPIPADGTGVTASITVPGQLALLTFTGVAGELVSATSTSSTWTSCQFGGQYSLSILKPDGSMLTNATNACGSTTMIQHQTLPTSGTYTLKLDPYGAYTGSATLKVWTFVDVTGSITADGTDVPVSITTPGQTARLTFDASSGQAVSILVPSGTIPGTCFDYAFWLTILKPDGSWLTDTPSCFGTAFLDQRTLPVSGTYTIVLDPQGTHTGDATVRLYTVVDVTGPITTDGVSVPVSLTTPGQNARLTFTGTAGQVVTASATNSTIPGTCFNYAFLLMIQKPDGSELASVPSCGGSVSLSQKTLPLKGTYTLLLSPYGPNTGSVTLKITSP